MALEIWAGEQADRLPIDQLIAAHKVDGLVLIDSATRKPLRLVDPAGEPMDVDDSVTELLRLAQVGAFALQQLHGPSRLEHFNWVINRARPLDDALLAQFGGGA